VNIPDELTPFLVPVGDLSELPGNPRRGDVEAVKRSYATFGQRKPIVGRRMDDGTSVVVAGNHQLKAARELGWSHIAVVWADDLTDDEAKAFALADNRVAELGGYDDESLTRLLEEVAEDSALLAATGYTTEDVERYTATSPVDPYDVVELDPMEHAYLFIVCPMSRREAIQGIVNALDAIEDVEVYSSGN
jgi:ParB-like chromosome segregation protein Spo0J